MTNYQATDTRDSTRYANTGKARKTWRCDFCGGEIKPQEPYEYSHAYGGGDVKRKCERCLIAGEPTKDSL